MSLELLSLERSGSVGLCCVAVGAGGLGRVAPSWQVEIQSSMSPSSENMWNCRVGGVVCASMGGWEDFGFTWRVEMGAGCPLHSLGNTDLVQRWMQGN